MITDGIEKPESLSIAKPNAESIIIATFMYTMLTKIGFYSIQFYSSLLEFKIVGKFR